MHGPAREFDPYHELLEQSWWGIFAELEQILWAGGSRLAQAEWRDRVVEPPRNADLAFVGFCRK